MAAIAGKNGRVSVNNGASVLTGVQDTVNESSDEIDVTTFECPLSSTNETLCSEFVHRPVTAEVSIDGIWDPAFNPHNDPPNIRASATLTNLLLEFDSVNLPGVDG